MIIKVGDADAVAVSAVFCESATAFKLTDNMNSRLVLAAAVPGRPAIYSTARGKMTPATVMSTDGEHLLITLRDAEDGRPRAGAQQD